MTIASLLKKAESSPNGLENTGEGDCSLREISLFPPIFSKDLYSKHVKTRAW